MVRKFSEEHRRNLSKAATGRKWSEEDKRKLSEVHKGQISLRKNKGKGWITSHGYKRMYKDCKRIFEHQQVWNNESEWGFVPDGFVVHHLNLNKLDNRIVNLTCIPKGYHQSLHEEIRRLQ